MSSMSVNTGLKLRSALSPLLLISVMERIRNISPTDVLRKIMHADDLVIVAEHREEYYKAHWMRGMRCLRNLT